jgi:hypothetical protein
MKKYSIFNVQSLMFNVQLRRRKQQLFNRQRGCFIEH